MPEKDPSWTQHWTRTTYVSIFVLQKGQLYPLKMIRAMCLMNVKLLPWSRVFDVITQKDKRETRNATWITIVYYNKKRTMSARVVHSYSNKSAPNPLCLVITDIINVPHCTVPLSDGTTSQTQMSLFGFVIEGLTNEMITYLCDWFLRCDTTVLKWMLCESHCSGIRPWGREDEKYGVPGQEKGKDWHAF